jgi:hydroxyquinol 1,2-dioxygenase
MSRHHATITPMQVDAQVRARLGQTPATRLGVATQLIVDHVLAVLRDLQPSEAEFDAFLKFLTDVGEATDRRRQEWVLLADVFGLSSFLADCAAAADGITPSVLRGPFYRPDAPQLAQGASLSRDRIGTPIGVRVQVRGQNGAPLAGAHLEVWHANGAGLYENQDPDNQPEHNLRGRFVADDAGCVRFDTIRPAGYRLPDDGPVGRLAQALGLSLDRPAHIHFAASAPGHDRLVTAIFDADDPAIGCDALYSVKPALIAPFGAQGLLDVTLTLAPAKKSADEGGTI